MLICYVIITISLKSLRRNRVVMSSSHVGATFFYGTAVYRTRYVDDE